MDRTNIIEAAREAALTSYLHNCDHNISSPNYKGWPMSVCDVCRGRFSEESFEAGFDAALSLLQWKDVADGLPEVDAERYVVRYNDVGRLKNLSEYGVCIGGFPEYWDRYVAAYIPYPISEYEKEG